MDNINVSIKLDSRKTVKYYGRKTTPQKGVDGTFHPVVFEFYYRAKRFYMASGVGLTKQDFQKLKSGDSRKRYLNDLWKELQGKQVQLREVTPLMKFFTLSELKRALGENPEQRSDIIVYFESHISKIESQDRISTFRTYRSGLVSIKKFLNGRPLPFDHLSSELLVHYEEWMTQDQGNSISTVGIHMRSLRTIVNAAISDGIMLQSDSPFGKNKYQIPASKNIKKALKLEQIGQIMAYEAVPGSAQEKYRDLWLFLYFGNGMNTTDMCQLKNKDLAEKSITFIRAKTKRSTRGSQSKIKVSILEPMREIIEKYRNTDHSPYAFLFPFLNPEQTEAQIRDKVHAVNRRINKHMRSIAEELGFDVRVTTYTARHSFASTLKKSNQPATIIADFLGHKNISTTQAYLDSIEDDQQEQIMLNLIPNK